MKIKLEQVGPYTCLPLPSQAAETAGYAPGDHVQVTWDAGGRRLVVRPLSDSRESPSPPLEGGDLAAALEEFLDQYSDALLELAADDHALPDGE